MSIYYNEIDPFACKWLQELMDEGLIPKGVIDSRSIEDVTPAELSDFTQCHFFAGIGGWAYALKLAGWPEDRSVWTGSCPCQPHSQGGKRKGIADERHLWPAFFWHIQQCRPSIVFGEQVSSDLGLKWLDIVQSDLEEEKYAIGTFDLPAASIGALHRRNRLYFCATNTMCKRLPAWNESGAFGTKDVEFAWRQLTRIHAAEGWQSAQYSSQPEIRPFAHGVPNRVGTVRGAGNAIVPQLAEVFIRSFMEVA